MIVSVREVADLEPMSPQLWQAVSALWDEGAALPAQERHAWLQRQRALGDPAMPHLEQLLEALGQVETGDFLEVWPSRRPPSSFTAGTLVGNYRLERKLGEGGMAEVWLARFDDGRLDRPVALKLLHHWRRGAAFASRVQRERDILATLDHPRIARLLDAGVAADGQPWLALEHVDGVPITDHADRLALGLRDRIALFRQVLLAVQHAHAKLVLHRDLKPSNILVTSEGWVKLLDFGIAKLLGESSGTAADTELTRAAGRPLTPQYASPEQIEGRELTTASDVYGLGVVLYELLCGRRPHEAVADRPGALERAVCELDPAPPSQRVTPDAAAARHGDMRSLRRALAGELDGLVLKAVSRAPDQRYTSVDALLADVDRWLAGEAVLARPPGLVLKLRKFVARHPVGTALGAVAVVGLVALTAVADVQRRRAIDESIRATAARDFMLDVFRRADPERTRGEALTAREVLETGGRDIARSLDGQPRLAAELLQGIGGVQGYMGQYRQADATLADAIARYRQAGDTKALALALVDAAGIAEDLGDPERSARLLDEAQHTGQPDDPVLAHRLALGRGWVARGRGQLGEARAAFEAALETAERAWGARDPRSLAARRALALTLGKAGEHASALAHLDAVRSQAASLPDATLNARERLDIDLDWLNVAYVGGRYADAVREGGSLVERCRATLGMEGPTCASVERLHILALLRTGHTQEATARLPAMLDRKDRNESPRRRAEGQLIGLRVWSEAGVLQAHPELQADVERLARAGADRSLGNAIPQRAALALAEAALQGRDFNSALAWVEHARAAGSLESWLQTRADLVVGLVREGQGRPDEALEPLRLSVAGHARALGEQHPMTLLVSLNLARVEEALGASGAVERRRQAIEPALVPALGHDSPLMKRVRQAGAGFFS